MEVAGGFCPSSQEYKKPPQLSFKLKEAVDVPKTTEMWNDDYLPIDILLLTAEKCDFLSCFSFLEQPRKSYKLEICYVYFGRMGDVASDHEKLKVALTNCSKGAATPGGALTVVQNALRILQPKAVFSVGTCIGLGLEKVKIGDVVVSSKLTTAEGFKIPVSPLLGDLARDAPFGWDAPLENPGELEVNIHSSGDILSQSLTANCRYDDICEQYPGAVAVETEGKGVYAGAYDADIEWMIVKGVASYFHQSQSATDEWKSFASTMAASVVAKILKDPLVFREWRHCKYGERH
ncbi:death domain-containing ATP nucleosidase-like isoform X3 [Acropora muricata]|uniref:death domain-containing ATP nucleosidase-like isoform X3 n=1 Tax=Acropora muricata TaxID=159855 RepID=UPI0034E3785F